MANDQNPQPSQEVAEQAESDRLGLLMTQIADTLGLPFLESVSRQVDTRAKCPTTDGCICAALLAYVALYEGGWAIVPIEKARQLRAMAN